MNDNPNNDADIIDVETGELTRIDPQTLTSIHKVEIDAQVTTAKQYPRRSLKAIRVELVSMTCLSDEIAEEMIYALPRGGKAIKGPSIRFAEVLASGWGNNRSEAYVVDINREEKYVEAVGVFFDLERNRGTRRRVRRRIVDKNGRIYNDDMVLVTGNAACSVAERNAILGGIPRPVWLEAYQQAYAMVAGTIQTLADKRTKALKAFAHFGVKPEQVFGILQVKDESEIEVDDIVTLRGMLSALRNQEETVESMFNPRRMGGQAFEQVGNPLADEDPDAPRKGTGGPVGSTAGSGSAHPAQQKAAGPAAPAQPSPEQIESDAPFDVEDAAEAGGKPVDTDKPSVAAEKQPEPKDAPAATAKAPQPKDEVSYIEYLRSWLPTIATRELVIDRFKGERKLRSTARVTSEGLATCEKMRDERIKELGG